MLLFKIIIKNLVRPQIVCHAQCPCYSEPAGQQSADNFKLRCESDVIAWYPWSCTVYYENGAAIIIIVNIAEANFERFSFNYILHLFPRSVHSRIFFRVRAFSLIWLLARDRNKSLNEFKPYARQKFVHKY